MEKGRDLRIRDARESDIAAIQRITVAAYEEYEAVLPPWAWEEYRSAMVNTIAEAGPLVERIVAEERGFGRLRPVAACWNALSWSGW